MSFYSSSLSVKSVVCGANKLLAGTRELRVGGFRLISALEVRSEGRGAHLALRHAQTKPLERHGCCSE